MAIDKAKIEEWKRLADEAPPEALTDDEDSEGRWRYLPNDDAEAFYRAARDAVPALIGEVERLQSSPLEDWDPHTGVAQIAGVKYDVAIFSGLGVAPPGTWVRIVSREDGVLTLQLRPDAEAERDRLRALLREVSFSCNVGTEDEPRVFCRFCRGDGPSEDTLEHFPDCPLAAALK